MVALEGGETAGPEQQAMDDRRATYLIEEFRALKAEIAAMVASVSANLQYALLASGGIFTGWLRR